MSIFNKKGFAKTNLKNHFNNNDNIRNNNFFEKKGFSNVKVNIKLVIAFIIGLLISGISVYAATVISSSEVSYTSNGQSTVKDAIDDLYSISSSWINPSYINFATLDTNVAQTILASSDGLCIKRNNKVSCFKRGNWAIEKDHVQEVFSDVTCTVTSDYVHCYASDFRCYVYSGGSLDFTDNSNNSGCIVRGDGNVSCDKPLGMKMNSAKTIVASRSAGMLFKRANGNVYFLGINNFAYEKEHIQEIFSDVGAYNSTTGLGCYVASDYVQCISSDFNVYISDDDTLSCHDKLNGGHCGINNSSFGCD